MRRTLAASSAAMFVLGMSFHAAQASGPSQVFAPSADSGVVKVQGPREGGGRGAGGGNAGPSGAGGAFSGGGGRSGGVERGSGGDGGRGSISRGGSGGERSVDRSGSDRGVADRGGRGGRVAGDRAGRGNYRGGHRYSRDRGGVGIYLGPGFGYYDGDYDSDCEWLRRRALDTGSRYWWRRFRDCVY